MRKEINVLWLDDNNDDDVLKMQQIFESVLDSNGYKANIIGANNYDEADSLMNDKSKRIDFFVSDFSLEEDKSGIDFLIKVRKSGKVKEHFILYSNNSKDSIRKSIKAVINEDLRNIDLLSNYYFFSTGPLFNDAFLTREFENSTNIALNRWNELTALRGEHASIHTLLEWITRKILSKVGLQKFIKPRNKHTYDDCISTLKRKINDGCLNCTLSSQNQNYCFDVWYDSKDSRNVLEHNVEKWDADEHDFLISNRNSSKRFLENKVADYRKELLGQIDTIKKLIDDLINNNSKLSSINNEQEYIDLSKGL